MHKRIVYILLSIFFVVTSCSKDDDGPDIPPSTSQTLFMYMPWSGNSNPDDPNALTSDFYNNIKDIETAMSQGIISNERILVFISTSPTEATLFELKYENKKNVRNTLKNYTNPPFTTAEGITSILNDMKSAAPADRYAMTIGCHGKGWLPVPRGARTTTDVKMHWEFTEGLRTRYFGGTSPQYQTDITTLAEGISNAGMKMEYILLDDCYMSTIEVAYDLKNVADYLIGCPTEILAYGMPYDEIGQYLIGNIDYESITEAFYNFYNNYKYEGTPAPYGTIGVTKCSEVDNLAAIMKEINGKFTFDSSLLNSLQRMDGDNPVTFFDFGHYVSKLCTDTDLLKRFDAQLKLTVPYKRCTKQFYSNSGGAYDINHYSGITVSDPSTSSKASAKAQTAWYKATH